MQILVTGGAGYIGSVVTEQLLAQGHGVVVYDNLSEGHREAIAEGVEFVEGDLLDYGTLSGALKRFAVEGVVHMAAGALVGESMTDPSKYYRINLTGGLSLLDAMIQNGVKKIVFSSTCATYGEPKKVPIEETDPQQPANPYGESKLSFEKAMQWYGRAYDLRHISLRYFNAAGATERFGEDHLQETHIIPIVLQAAAGKRNAVEIYGDDYPTPDGTCIRDYVHVIDIAQAHSLALSGLGERNGAYNLGCGGDGYSVKQVIQVAEKVAGVKINVKIGPRRSGDPAALIASSSRIKKELGWSPRYQDLQRIIDSAWKWMKSHPDGYGS
ncbi:MAG TPA: UDP-glucose 4-epimerase GalE [Blastocatellia bacterium]|nr:UDP-glucose 4-epimerase GalE [Blastocatellia bacterium]